MPSATPSTPNELVKKASVSIRQALDTWKATDLGRIADSQLMLAQAVEDLKGATAALISVQPGDIRELQSRTARLRRDLARITQIVDACLAFQNGLAVRLGVSGVVYNSTGSAPPASFTPIPEGIEA